MELFRRNHQIMISLALLLILSAWHCEAQPSIDSNAAARQLDSLLQDYAYGAFVHPRTGTPYDGVIPSNLTGTKVAVLRLRCGSLRARGFHGYKEFDIPIGVIVQPYVKRLAFVYQNLGNWSSFYYPLPGCTYLAPVLGLLAYSAANLSATSLSELHIMASGSPIAINFLNVRSAPSGFTAKCVRFDLNASAPSGAPSPSPPPGKGHKFRVWKIVVSVVGGLMGLLLLSLLVAWLASFRKKKLMEMQKKEDVGEVLQMERIGNTRLPVAPMTRTQPVIQNDYVP